MSRHVDVVIEGIPVTFPVQPYDVQVELMTKVIQSLQQKHQNALLESPTGTGKTLALLCSLLGWQRHYKQQLAEKHARLNGGAQPMMSEVSGMDLSSSVPTIIYCSRTHSQLSQVINELKRTVYRPKMTILSSREQACVHESVRNRPKSEIRYACRNKCAENSCTFRENVEAFALQNLRWVLDGVEDDSVDNLGAVMDDRIGSLDDQQLCSKNLIMDIEDLVSKASSDWNICPYFLARNDTLNRAVELVFMPYNYLVDPWAREGLKLQWKNAVIVVDEAHNLGQICDEAASFSLSEDDFTFIRKELDESIRRIHSVDKGKSDVPNLEAVLRIKQCVQDLETYLRSIELKSSSIGYGKRLNGDQICKVFEIGAKIDARAAPVLLDRLSELIRFLGRAPNLEKFSKAVSRVFVKHGCYDPQVQAAQFYNVYLEQTKVPGNGNVPKLIRVLHFWCFSPSVALSEIKTLGIHSMILTSGTLAPIDTFASELGVEFPIRLENPHVVGSNQIWIGTLTNGVTGKQLNSTFGNRDKPVYMTELGNTITNVLRITPGGILVFFPSYHVMNFTIQFWRTNGIYDRMDKLKRVVIEARHASEMGQCVQTFESFVARGRGAVFFAVCRGKASEGIDFSDSKARMVIITGLPFPPIKDPRVSLKSKFLDKYDPKKLMPEATTMTRLSGNVWYSQQAFRAVNQAIGRIIRHKNDFGAVLLLDDRFARRDAKQALSSWLRPMVQSHSQFSKVHRGLIAFYANNGVKPNAAASAAAQGATKQRQPLAPILASSSSSSMSIGALIQPLARVPTKTNTKQLKQASEKGSDEFRKRKSEELANILKKKQQKQQQQPEPSPPQISHAGEFMRVVKTKIPSDTYSSFKSTLSRIVAIQHKVKNNQQPPPDQATVTSLCKSILHDLMQAHTRTDRTMLTTNLSRFLPKEHWRDTYDAILHQP